MKKITLIFVLLTAAIFSWQSSAQMTYDNACTTTFEDISASGAVIMQDDGTTPLSDDGEGNITLPFAFTLDGVVSSDLRVGNNGGVLFGATSGGVGTNSTQTAIGFYPFVDDLDSDQGSVVWETLGTMPNRRVVIMWNDRNHFAFPTSVGGITFEIILFEATNEVTFLYQDVVFGDVQWDNAVSAGIHVIGADGTYTYSVDTDLAGVTCINWTPPTCLKATGLEIVSDTTTSVDLAWTDPNGLTAMDYEYVVQAVGTGEPAVAGTATTTNPQTLSGLTAATTYEVYLRANCGASDFGAWTKIDFSTACDPFNDFTEDFDSTTAGDLTLCWHSHVNTSDSNSKVTVEATDPNSGANAMELFNGTDNTATSEVVLVSPNLADMQNGDHRVRFMAKGTGLNPAIVVGTMTDPNDYATFVTFSGVLLSNTYTEYSVVVSSPPAGANYIAFKHYNSDVNQIIRIDDYTWEPTPACLEPSSVYINAITSAGATISWVENNLPQAEWDLYIVPAGDAAPTNSSMPTEDNTTNSFTFTSGTPNTAYDVYARADCDHDNVGVSAWVGPQTFSTICTTYVGPFTEDFEDAGNVDDCWTQETADDFDWTAHSGGTVSGSTGPSAANSGTYYIYTESSSPVVLGDVATIYSPNIDIASMTDPRLNFAYHMYGMAADGNVDVAISTDGGASYASVFNQAGDQGDQWNNALVSLASYTGVVSFRITATVSTTGDNYANDFAIDDFKVEETPAGPPACATVTGADLDAACGDRGMQFSWPAVVGATGYRITAATTSGGNDLADDVDLGGNTTFDIATTTSNTAYFCTVTAYNALGDAVGCTEVTFTTFATGCICESVPSSNDGNGMDNVQIGATDYTSLGDVTYEDHTGGIVVDLNQDIVNNVQLTYGHSATYFTKVWIDLNDDLVFDEATEKMFEGVSAGAPSVLDASFGLPIGAVVGQHRMRIVGKDFGPLTSVIPCYNGSWGVTLDFTVNILPLPSCLAVSNVLVSDVTNNGATIAWTDNNSPAATNWDVYIVPAGDAAPDASSTPIVNDSLTQTVIWVNGSEVTDYEVYVRTDCGGDNTDVSLWVGPIAFTTDPNCFAPTDILISDITADGATIAWTENNSPAATAWDLYIVPAGDAAPDAVSTLSEDNTANNPFIWSGGNEVTDYDVYVRTDCGSNNTDVSVWTGPVSFTTNPSCFAPTDLMVTNIDATATTADFSWTDNNVVAPINGWEYEIVDITNGGTPTEIGIAAPTNPISVTGLVAGIDYNLLVRSVCGASGSESSWSTAYAWTQMNVPGCVTNPSLADGTTGVVVGSTTFTWDVPTGTVDSYDVYGGLTSGSLTLLGNVTTASYNYDVNVFGATFYWKVIAKNAGGESVGCNEWSFSSEDAPACGDTFTDVNGAGADYANNENVTWIITPDTVGEVVTIDFTSFNTEQGWDGLMVYNGPDTTYPLIDSGSTYNRTTCPNGAWNGNDAVSTNLYVPTSFTSSDSSGALTFVFRSDGGGTRAGWEANVTCAAPPVCAAPTALMASNMTDLTADLSWTENGAPEATNWDIEWGTTGFTPGDGTMISGTTDNPYALTGLTASTSYDFYVKSNCSAPYESGWSVAFTFTTAATPSCLVPTGLSATNITNVSADLSWNEINTTAAMAWDIEWATAGFTQGGGTMVTATGDNPYALTGLAALTNYEFYVRADCGAIDGVSTWTGPFAFTTVANPPVNDNLCDAIEITPDATAIDADNTASTQEASEPIPTCWDLPGNQNTVWFYFDATSTEVQVSTDFTTALNDTAIAIYSLADCTDMTTLTELGCNEDIDLAGGNYLSLVDLTGLTIGNRYYVQVDGYGGGTGAFKIEVTATNLSTNDLASVGFNYYPNPVTNNLTMTANENITSVSIFNMLGQEVRNEKLSTLEANIDMSNLANGTYFVKAQVGQSIGTFKIVKK